MSLAWAAFGAEWALAEKVSFNGVTKRITVNAGVTALDIREDVYSAWVRWVPASAWPCASRASTPSRVVSRAPPTS